MLHDFLTALHSEAGGSPEILGVASEPARDTEGRPRADDRRWAKDLSEAAPMLAPQEKHRTVGVSLSPSLRQRAAARARALGLPFSRYVAWCVEAELEGRPPQARFDRVPPGPARDA